MTASPLALKTDLDALEGRLNLKLATLETKIEALRGEVKSDVAPIKWMGIVGVGGILTLVFKAFLLP